MKQKQLRINFHQAAHTGFKKLQKSGDRIPKLHNCSESDTAMKIVKANISVTPSVAMWRTQDDITKSISAPNLNSCCSS
ncbi:hypothetical protein GWI33_011422 [Rhynchophorus ferrugineus]|uniref:Uncharacterized protein n=1 Tax=Rhynchophorus ferrugineus TaxID=354439 RepID=A0A834IWP9_RHYFE|nr:hypothetical protein GWI33_011422 [Rhynchophorus ferrugineus]